MNARSNCNLPPWSISNYLQSLISVLYTFTESEQTKQRNLLRFVSSCYSVSLSDYALRRQLSWTLKREFYAGFTKSEDIILTMYFYN